MSKIINAYALYDEDEGLWYETLADSPMEAIQSIGDVRSNGHHDEQLARMMVGKLRVREVRVEVGSVADFIPKRQST